MKFHENPSGEAHCCLMRTDWWKDTTTLVVSLHSFFAKAPNVYPIFIFLSLYEY